jgi:hypothetical protein
LCIYIFQAWYRELLLKDAWDDGMKIVNLDWSHYDCFCREYQKDKVTTMPAPAGPIGYKQPTGTLCKKLESGIFGTHFQKMQNSQIP